jgi:choline dehydrogenase
VSFDYVIVGAGSAGCVLASRLSEDPHVKVLLLEAGPPDSKRDIKVPIAFSRLFLTEVDWQYYTAPEPQLGDREIYWPRGKTLGGCSSINAMVYMRGNPLDYDEWERLGNEGWSWEDVLPYFKKAERNERGPSDLHGGAGPLNVADLRYVNPLTRAWLAAAEECGLPANADFNGRAQEGVGLLQVTQKNGARVSAADAYLRPARRRPNLKVVTGADVTKVLIEDGRAAGVQYRMNGTTVTETAGREVILSAGTVNSPKLLMLSGVGPGAHLAEHGITVVCELPGVGQNLQDHLAIGLRYASRLPVSLAAAGSRRELVRWLVQRRGMLTSTVMEGNGFVRSRPELPAPDLQLAFGPALYSGDPTETVKEHGFSTGVFLLRPKSVGEIRLRSPDAGMDPVIRANYLSDPVGEDMRTVIWGLKLCRKIVAGRALDPSAATSSCPGRAWRTTRTGRPTCARRARPSTTRSAPARWARTGWRSSTTSCACTASRTCASLTPRSCR